MSKSPCQFVWYELMTTDAAAAEKFYQSVVGWTIADAGMPGMKYSLLSAGTAMVGGLMALSQSDCDAGARPGWVGYVGVDDVDACAVRVKAAGGSVHKPADDIPGVGRFAVVADPHGAVFTLFKGDGEAPVPVAPNTPGHVGWHELHAGNGEAAEAFYSAMFGWTPDRQMDMGPMGVYRIFAAGAAAIGGMMTKAAEMPSPFWLYYFNVDGIDAALARVQAGGGKVMMGPHQVPTGDWILMSADPQGAMFALVSLKR